MSQTPSRFRPAEKSAPSETSPKSFGPARLDHLNLSVRDFEESARWYHDVFGFEIVEQGLYAGEPWGVLRVGDSMLCIYQSPALVPLPANDALHHRIYHFALRLADASAWADHAHRLKLPLEYGGPIRYPRSTSWYVRDPSGYSIEVVVWDDDRVRFPGTSGNSAPSK